MLVDDLRLAVMRLSRRARLERDENDISDAQSSVLFLLKREGARTLADLAKREKVTSPSLFRTVRGILDAGLVERVAHPDDGRKILLSVTPAGEAHIARVRERRSAWFARQLAILSPEERSILEAATPILQKLADA